MEKRDAQEEKMRRRWTEKPEGGDSGFDGVVRGTFGVALLREEDVRGRRRGFCWATIFVDRALAPLSDV